MVCLRNSLILISFVTHITVGSNQGEENQSLNSDDFILCRHCGYNISPASTVINVKSPSAESVDYHALFGLPSVGVQTLRNPFGIEFNVITSRGGTCMGLSQHWQMEDSWFPGYAWKPCTCSKCKKVLGWVFEPITTASNDRVFASLKGFYALNLDRVISEAYADSLIAAPKFY